MKAVIVEDEIVASQNLKRLIAQASEDIEVITVLQTVEESIEWFTLNTSPDVVFMDIHLADGSAFSIFEKVKIGCPIIFTTAYDQYALKAFEVNSIDYLLKPINTKNFERAIEKLRNLTTNHVDQTDIISTMLASLKQTKEVYKSHFLIPYKDKFVPLAVDHIACFYTENKMAKIVMIDNQTYTLDSTLEELYAQLNPLQFFRANRQYIVSHKAIKDLTNWFGSKLSINLHVTVPDKIIVSKARVSEFKSWYTN